MADEVAACAVDFVEFGGKFLYLVLADVGDARFDRLVDPSGVRVLVAATSVTLS